jgi:hypothetical protein
MEVWRYRKVRLLAALAVSALAVSALLSSCSNTPLDTLRVINDTDGAVTFFYCADDQCLVAAEGSNAIVPKQGTQSWDLPGADTPMAVADPKTHRQRGCLTAVPDPYTGAETPSPRTYHVLISAVKPCPGHTTGHVVSIPS